MALYYPMQVKCSACYIAPSHLYPIFTIRIYQVVGQLLLAPWFPGTKMGDFLDSHSSEPFPPNQI